MYKIAVLSSTNGTNLQSFIDAKANGELAGVEIVCFITDQFACGALLKAEAAGIPTYWVDPTGLTGEAFDQEVVEILDGHSVDLVVLAGYMRIVGPKMVERYKQKIVNVHPSLLPKYAGKTGSVIHRQVVEAKDVETGISIHFVDAGLDTGSIILQKKVAVERGDTADAVKKKVQALEVEWYPKVVEMFAEGKIGV